MATLLYHFPLLEAGILQKKLAHVKKPCNRNRVFFAKYGWSKLASTVYIHALHFLFT